MKHKENFGIGPVTIDSDKEYTKDPIGLNELPENGVFVFGSNKQGEHYGGAARFAHKELGAEWGVGEGFTGRCYAFPTLNMANTIKEEVGFMGDSKVSVDEFYKSFELLEQTVKSNPAKKFYITKLGLGIAGWSLETVHELFWRTDLGSLENVVYPMEFEKLDSQKFMEELDKSANKQKEYEIPNSFDEAVEHIAGLYYHNGADEYIVGVTLDKFMSGAHHFIGTKIRNQWGLWRKTGKLYEELNSFGLWHADDMSACILKAVWYKLNNKYGFDLMKEAEHYKKYWEKLNINENGERKKNRSVAVLKGFKKFFGI